MDAASFSIPGAAKPASGKPGVVDVTEGTFPAEVVERSRETTVIVDLWAEWCGPCRQLSPVLERLAGEADGQWVLAKIDVDKNPRLAEAFGVQGIPAVKAVRDATIIGEFTGAMPEAQVRAWLGSLGIGDAAPEMDRRLIAGLEAERRGDLDAAMANYQAVLADDPAQADARGGAGRVELVRRLRAADIEGCLRRVSADPLDVEAATVIADAELASGHVAEALARLVDVVRRTSGAEREQARKHLIGLFELLPAEDPRVLAARRELASALY